MSGHQMGFPGQGLGFDPALLLGAANFSSFQERYKALVAQGAGGLNATGFVPEDLERTAHMSLWGRNDLHLSREMPDVTTKSVNHEFQYVDSFGKIFNPLFQAEAGLGVQEAYSGQRFITRIVTLSHVNKVSGEAMDQQQVNVLGSTNPLKSNREAVMRVHLFKKAIQLIWCRAGVSNSKLKFKGLLEQFFERNVSAAYANEPESVDPLIYIDKRATSLGRSDIEDKASDVYDDAWGQMNRVYMDIQTSKGFQGEVQANFAVERAKIDDSGPEGIIIGTPIRGIQAQSGTVEFRVDNSFAPQYSKVEPYDEETRKGRTLSVNSGAPAKPATPAYVVNAGPVTGSKWAAPDVAGPALSIKYRVQAENDFGLSEPSDISAAGVIAATDSTSLSFVSSADANSYHILRTSDQNVDRYFRIGEVKNTGGVLNFTDLNHQIPGTGMALGLAMLSPKTKLNRAGANADDNSVRWAKLRGLTTKYLAPIGDFDWEMILERTSPELVQHTRVRVWYNLPSRFYPAR